MAKLPLSDDDINNPTTWKEKGNDFFSKGQYEDAIKCYARAIEIDPEYLDAWNNIGYALIKLGKTDEAKKCNEKVKELKLKNKGSSIPDTSYSVASKDDFYPTPPQEKEGLPDFSIGPPVIQTDKEKEVTSSSNIEAGEKEYCRNCGEELPYRQGEWPPSLPKLCPNCGVRIKDPFRYGSRAGQGRTHSESLKNPTIAAILSIIPGLGQAYNGQILRGLLFFFATGIGLLLLVFPGIIVWIFGIYDSYRTAKKMNYGDIPFKNTSVKLIVGYILLLLIISGVAAAGYSYFANPSKNNALPIIGKTSKIATLEKIVREYHQTHTYMGDSIYVCGDMASDVWNMVETQNINAMIVIGNVERDITKIEDADHAWVIAEVDPNSWIALETTGGYLVCDDPKICPVSNPRYFTGWKFANPKLLNDAIELLKHPCPTGYVFGEDQKCHPACGGSHYCIGDSICVNGECVACDEGYILGDDLQCHKQCGSTRSYCTGDSVCVNGECRTCPEGSIMGNDLKCHQPCGSTKTYCTGDSICINGECRSCPSGYIFGTDYQCHQECPIGSNQYCLRGTCGADGLCHLY